MQFSFVCLLALTRLVAADSHPKTFNINEIFRPVLSSEAEIYLGSDYHKDVVPRWSTYKEPSYVATIKPASEEDVQMIVSSLRKRKLLAE